MISYLQGTMRERVEDLGRLAVMLRELIYKEYNLPTHNGLWECLGRPKDAEDEFNLLSEEKKREFIHSLAYTLQSILWDLHEMLRIAEGTDELNELPS